MWRLIWGLRADSQRLAAVRAALLACAGGTDIEQVAVRLRVRIRESTVASGGACSWPGGCKGSVISHGAHRAPAVHIFGGDQSKAASVRKPDPGPMRPQSLPRVCPRLPDAPVGRIAPAVSASGYEACPHHRAEYAHSRARPAACQPSAPPVRSTRELQAGSARLRPFPPAVPRGGPARTCRASAPIAAAGRRGSPRPRA